MKVLVTGSGGLIGAQVVNDLRVAGHEPVAFDIAQGQDILDHEAVDAATEGCHAVVHSAAMLGHEDENDQQLFEVNVSGTRNVLAAAVKFGVERFVYLSSVNVLGVFKGERAPDYLPIDDDHPKYPATAYGVSKLLGEEMCRMATVTSDITAIALRPPAVWTPEQCVLVRAYMSRTPTGERQKNWEYGAFIDNRDMARACVLAIECDVDGFEATLVTGPDVATLGPDSKTLATLNWPEVEWRGDNSFETRPNRSLVDCRRARDVLGFDPKYTWAEISQG